MLYEEEWVGCAVHVDDALGAKAGALEARGQVGDGTHEHREGWMKAHNTERD